jgi:hypothetical protein
VQLKKKFKNSKIFKTALFQHFFLFSVLSSRMEPKKAIENRTAVYFCLHQEYYHLLSIFWEFLLLCSLVSNIFTMFFSDSEVCLERYNSYGDFGYLIKNQTFLFEEKFVKEHFVLLLEPWLCSSS